MSIKNSVLKSVKSSDEWLSGYPCGNGHTGFMLWGESGSETLSFNHEELFRKKIKKDIKSAHVIPEIRRLTLMGDSKSAESLFNEAAADCDPFCNPYQTFCELKLGFKAENVTDYYRTLDLSTGITSVKTNTYSIEAFTDLNSDTNVFKIEFTEPCSLKIEYSREADPECETNCDFIDGFYRFNGRFIEGVSFSAKTFILSDGDLKSGKAVEIENCKRVELRTVLTIGEEKAELSEKDYLTLKAQHIESFKKQFEKFDFSITNEQKNSEQLYIDATKNLKYDNAIYEYFVNLAKYVYITAGNGKLPLNLQGIWCDKIKPMWDCGYTTDINVQMAYFPANAIGFGDYQFKLFDWLDSHTDTMSRQCEHIFGIKDAAYVPQYTDVDMVPSSWRDFGSFQVLWSGAAAWLARHHYEYWKTTGDDEFMLKCGLPYMKRCAKFYEEFLFKNEEGKYKICPSCNPENFTAKDIGQLIDSATMDISIIHELMQNLIDVHNRLSIDEPLISVWQEIDQNLIDYPFFEDGTLAEYWTEKPPIEEDHRHLSHVYGMYPAKLFKGDEKMEIATEKALALRHRKGFRGTSSWSMSWHACLAARMGKAEKAREYINYLAESMLMENYLPSHNDWREGTRFCFGDKIFQIDAIFGITAAICEMLIYSDDNAITLLPTLPVNFQKGGFVKGLCGYGGTTFDVEWKNGEIINIKITAKKEVNFTLKTGMPVKNGDFNATGTQISLRENQTVIF